MYLLVLWLPLVGFFISGIFGFYFGRNNSCTLSVLCVFFAALSSLFIFYEVVLCYSMVSFKLYDWMCLGSIKISFGLFYDSLTCIMLIIVT
jgi:NADH:ubiquinone oxidoreductase subunit 5 (subunit L)/multisubunit Na+/H+ antiporter MnhA subunit